MGRLVANSGQLVGFLSDLRMDDDEIVRQGKSLLNVPDPSRKIIVARDHIAPYLDYDGIPRISLLDFLLKPDSLDM